MTSSVGFRPCRRRRPRPTARSYDAGWQQFRWRSTISDRLTTTTPALSDRVYPAAHEKKMQSNSNENIKCTFKVAGSKPKGVLANCPHWTRRKWYRHNIGNMYTSLWPAARWVARPILLVTRTVLLTVCIQNSLFHRNIYTQSAACTYTSVLQLQKQTTEADACFNIVLRRACSKSYLTTERHKLSYYYY